jgi:hypothetical protein
MSPVRNGLPMACKLLTMITVVEALLEALLRQGLEVGSKRRKLEHAY